MYIPSHLLLRLSPLPAVLTKQQATAKFESLLGGGPGPPRLWLEAHEVPGLLGAPSKSECLQIRHLFFRGGRLLYRHPEVASRPGRRPNPRGAPPRVAAEKLWGALGETVSSRMHAFDWEAFGALEAAVKAKQQIFFQTLKKTVGELSVHLSCL